MRPTRRQLLRIPLHSFSTENTLLVCLFNARSVGTSRRRSDISTFILDNNIDIMLLTETWLRPAGDEAKIADLAPPGYSVLSFPRSSGGPSVKGGGIAFVLRDSLKQHVSSTSSFPVQHPCFEAAQ
ncbi:endonuclease/exonuclease/phosphatase family protein, partial [Thiolapillus sp.]